MTDRANALENIAALVAEHHLTRHEVEAVLGWTELEPATTGSTVPRVLGYLGGLFIIAGIGALISLNWDAFPSILRVGITLGLGLALYLSVTVFSNVSLRAFANPILALSQFLQPAGILVAFNEYAPSLDGRIAALVASLAMLGQALVTLRFDKAGQGVLLFAALFFGSFAFAIGAELADVDGDLTAIALGLGLMLVAMGIDALRHRFLAQTAALVGSVCFFLGIWSQLEGSVIEPVFALLAIGGIYLSTHAQIRALLISSLTALLAYIGYFTAEHFADSLGWPVLLILLGAVFLGLGYWIVRKTQHHFA